MRIYIIRHGQTEWNKSGRLQGQTDIALNENGKELAKKVGIAMKDICFDRVISSPLTRAVDTARAVLQENCGRAGERMRAGENWNPIEEDFSAAWKDQALLTDERIREISFGVYEGYSVPSAMFRGDDRFSITDPDFHNFFDAPEKYRAPKAGESLVHLVERTGEFLNRLAGEECLRGETILISTHGAVSRAFLSNIMQLQLKDFWYQGVPKNCSVSIAETVDKKWKLLEQDVLYI